MPRRSWKSNQRTVVASGYAGCYDMATAIRLVRALGSDDSLDWSKAARRLVAGSIMRFLYEHQDHVDHIEWGCKELLLQAAKHVGENRDR